MATRCSVQLGLVEYFVEEAGEYEISYYATPQYAVHNNIPHVILVLMGNNMIWWSINPMPMVGHFGGPIPLQAVETNMLLYMTTTAVVFHRVNIL